MTDSPDQVLVMPPWRREAADRWVVRLWRNPARASFSHYQSGRLTMERSVAWSPAGWADHCPSPQPPAALIARAHRCLRQLQRTTAAASPAERLASIQRQRTARHTARTPVLLKP